jgi:hypothetical protein
MQSAHPGMSWLFSSTVFSVEEVAHRFSAGRVRFAVDFALNRVCGSLGCGFFGISRAALWTSVGEARLVWLQFKFL